MPTRGMTPTSKQIATPTPNFNSHAHEGHDRYLLQFRLYGTYFNSHAHEGHDRAVFVSDKILFDFNSHAHEGHDPVEKNDCYVINKFQLTCPRGA